MLSGIFVSYELIPHPRLQGSVFVKLFDCDLLESLTAERVFSAELLEDQTKQTLRQEGDHVHN